MTPRFTAPVPDPVIEHASTLVVTVTVTQVGMLIMDRVPFTEPVRLTERRYLVHRCQPLDDLPAWPEARRRVEAEAEEMLAAITAALSEQGLVPTQMAAMDAAPNSREVTR